MSKTHIWTKQKKKTLWTTFTSVYVKETIPKPTVAQAGGAAGQRGPGSRA